ncbi:C39 family peptidase [Secundilactobacillus kimchicus]|uniref:C39 family peptidase n=1 Tax=Secundilactobacillus kimchicus TaxID=528209 RepID=UPI000B159AE5|nr:C39 family peptidase [Secundilactobacillus kimchicus]
MKLSRFILGSAIGLVAGLSTIYLTNQKKAQAPTWMPNGRLFDDFSGVDLTAFGVHVTQATADESAVVLAQDDQQYFREGVMTTPAFSLPEFKHLIISWNALTPPKTSVEAQARVWVNGHWSDWHSWGHWSTNLNSASVEDDISDPEVTVDTDTLRVLTGTADKAQLRAILRSSDPSQTPVLKLLGASVDPVSTDLRKDPRPISIDRVLPAPAYSQEIRDPQLAPGICSPTTISMAVNAQSADILPEEAALKNYDTSYEGFGNWAFSSALAGSMGYEAFTVYTDLNGLRRQIQDGFPVGVSVRYTNDTTQTELPYVENAPGATFGHLLLVTGFTQKDGIEYVAVNDSYAASDETVSRLYRLDQFDAAWQSRVAYIVRAPYNGYEQIMQPVRFAVDVTLASDQQHLEIRQGGAALTMAPQPTTQPEAYAKSTTTVLATFDDATPAATTAALPMTYLTIDESGRVAFDLSEIKERHPLATSMTLYVIRMSQPTLTGTLAL